MKNHFETLGLQEGASQEEIKAAYEHLSKELNPANNDNQEFFIEEYNKVQEAYKALYNFSILATEKAEFPKDQSKESQSPKIKNRISKRDFAFGGLLFFIAIGVWGLFLQNMGFFVPSDDFTQKVRVVNTVETYSQGGNVDVSGSVRVNNTVDVNLLELRGYTPWINTSRTGHAVLGVFAETTTLGN